MAANAKKKKHGDHWSSPEVINNIVKKPNMADGDEEEVFEDCSEDEPTLLQIKEILTTIQSSVSSILTENVKFKEDMAELKTALKSNERELKELKASLASANRQSAELAKRNYKRRRKSLKIKLKKLFR